ncbi:MAG: 2-amino-4-oxopentanoate thiolase subunit OrtA [Bacilli bacterium]|jgi:hypothetical protein|nr:2-amino-4-oxopentanoate thiolase subunit OrtA [Bacilli bacterium]
MIQKGSWVLIERIVLEPQERSSHIPEDTKKTPLKMWVKGTLLEDAEMFDWVHIKTKTHRLEEGKLIEVNPTYRHSYGEFVPELLRIETLVRSSHE